MSQSKLEIVDNVATLTMNKPPDNRLGVEMMDEFDVALDEVTAQRARVLILVVEELVGGGQEAFPGRRLGVCLVRHGLSPLRQMSLLHWPGAIRNQLAGPRVRLPPAATARTAECRGTREVCLDLEDRQVCQLVQNCVSVWGDHLNLPRREPSRQPGRRASGSAGLSQNFEFFSSDRSSL